jgi:hypothetical protein
MNRNEKTEYIVEVEKHLQHNRVYELMEKLTRDLIVHQPADPLSFLIDRLKHPEGRHVCNRQKNFHSRPSRL